MNFISLTNISKKDAKKLIDVVNDKTDLSPFIPDQTRILAEDLAFYPNAKICELTDDSAMPLKHLFVLYHGDGAADIVEYSYDWVQQMNKRVQLSLTAETIPSYVDFYFNHIALKGGKMQVLRSIEDMPWRDEPPMEARSSLSALLTPFLVDDSDPKTGFQLVFSALYAGSIFTIHADLSPNGALTVTDQEEIAIDLPVFSQSYAV